MSYSSGRVNMIYGMEKMVFSPEFCTKMIHESYYRYTNYIISMDNHENQERRSEQSPDTHQMDFGNQQNQQSQQPAGAENSQQATDASNEKVWALLSYIGILFIIPMLVAKESRFAQFHAKQGVALFVAEVITMFIAWIPILGWIVGFVAWIVWVVLAIIGILNVINDKQKPLPLLGGLAAKF